MDVTGVSLTSMITIIKNIARGTFKIMTVNFPSAGTISIQKKIMTSPILPLS